MAKKPTAGDMCASSRFFGKRGGHYCVKEKGHGGKHGPFCCVRHIAAIRAIKSKRRGKNT